MSLITKKQNWIKKVKTLQSVNRTLVLRELEINEEDYWDMVLDAGTQYLVKVLQVGDCINDVLGATLYWKWWVNHWQKWDALWLEERKQEHPWLRVKLYDQLHDASAKGFAPNRVVMRELFCTQVLDELIREEENAKPY